MPLSPDAYRGSRANTPPTRIWSTVRSEGACGPQAETGPGRLSGDTHSTRPLSGDMIVHQTRARRARPHRRTDRNQRRHRKDPSKRVGTNRPPLGDHSHPEGGQPPDSTTGHACALASRFTPTPHRKSHNACPGLHSPHHKPHRATCKTPRSLADPSARPVFTLVTISMNAQQPHTSREQEQHGHDETKPADCERVPPPQG